MKLGVHLLLEAAEPACSLNVGGVNREFELGAIELGILSARVACSQVRISLQTTQHLI